MGKIMALPGGDVPPVQVLDGAFKRDFKEVMVLGVLADGDLFLASSKGKLSDINFLLDKIKFKVLNGDFSE